MDALIRHKLTHAMTEYDRKQSVKPGYNMYALAHYCGAVQRAEERIDEGQSIRSALVESFTGRLLDVMLKAIGEPKSTRDEQRF